MRFVSTYQDPCMWRIVIPAMSILLCQIALAQQVGSDSAIHVSEVVITETRLENFSTGTKVQEIDSATLDEYKQDNLTDLLVNETGIFIKTYGLGSLASTSLRGGNAHQTTTLWNGFNLNSPMNGQLDLSLVPAGIANSVKIQYGGTSALWGSGAIGGVIHLNSIPAFDRGITASAGFEAGSFKTFGERVSLEMSKPKWVTGLKLSHSSAKNNFPYRNYFLPDKPEVRQTNNALKTYSALLENFFSINQNQKLNLFFWYQYADREIPPTMVQGLTLASQKDESYRVTSEWQFTKRKKQLFIRAAYFDEDITYAEPVYDYSAYSRSQSWITEAETRITFGLRHHINTGFNNTFIRAVADGYPNRPQQNRAALFASYKYTTLNKNYSVCVSARQELVGGDLAPFTFSTGTDLKLAKWLWAKASVARVYRIPTFNDLYWIPGANPNLVAERGFSEDAGVRFLISKNSKYSFSFEPVFFNRNIENWIIWLPTAGYWTPQNIMKVWSRGLEVATAFTCQIGKVKISASLFANYVLSTNAKSKTANDASIGRQLIYVPKIKLNGKISVEYAGFTLTYRHDYAGVRYTTTDNSDFLPGYHVAGMRLAKNVTIKSWRLSAFIESENLFNEEYQVILSRPMPFRSFNGGLTIQFSKPFSKNKHNNNNEK